MRAVIFIAIVGAVSCKTQWYGTSNVYAWNGTDDTVRLQLEGSDALDVTLRPQSGELLRDVTAGPYTVVTKHKDGTDTSARTELRKGDLTILNVDGMGCFARTDVAGKYTGNGFPVKVMAEYAKDTVIRVDAQTDVLPGELLPQTRPKSVYGFYRVNQVPCELMGDRTKIAEHLREVR